MYAHCVAADLGNVFVCKRYLVAPIAGAHQIGKILCAVQLRHLRHGLIQRFLCAEHGIDAAAQRYIGCHFAGFIQNHTFCISTSGIASAVIIHIAASSCIIVVWFTRLRQGHRATRRAAALPLHRRGCCPALLTRNARRGSLPALDPAVPRGTPCACSGLPDRGSPAG